jgi:hypothetical protein
VIIATSLRKKGPSVVTDIKTISHAITGGNGPETLRSATCASAQTSELMRMWPISTRVNKPENDDPLIVEPIQLTTDAA